jgi:hypothetical protein
MRTKLTLNLDQLTVDSFDTAPERAEKGTVFGEECTCYTCHTNCTCPGCYTCDHTYCDQDTCQVSCDGTCDGAWTCGDTCDYTCRPRLCPKDPY